MSVSINNCPKCSLAVLPDTLICPSCGHEFDKARAEELRRIEQERALELDSAEMEDPCPKCGVMVRSGMVRCWDCGAFMRKEIAEKYVKLQTTPQPIVYSQPTDAEEYLPPRRGEDEIDIADPDTYTASESDFELEGDLTAPESAGDGDFQLSPGLSAPAAPAATPPPAAPPQQPAAPAAPQQDATAQPAAAQPAPDAQPAADAQPDAEGKPAEAAAPGDAAPAKMDEAPAKSSDVSADDLLNVAIAEEAESVQRKRQRRKKRLQNVKGILVFCPRGHRIEVPNRFAGRLGKCPKCKATFTVPVPDKSAAPAEPEQKSITVAWLRDVCLHHVDPGTLKLKSGSLQPVFGDVDLMIDESGIHILTLVARKKLAKTADKQKSPVRDEITDHLQKGLSMKKLPVADRELIDKDTISTEFSVAYPTPLPHESMFAGIPVFGEGRIALRLPARDGVAMRFLSLELSAFLHIAEQLREQLDISDFGANSGIPFTPEYDSYKCHYSAVSVKGIQKAEYYEADPEIELEIAGHKCECCGVAVSEESRAKEKLGGANGRGLPKAKCPKCSGKFGKIPLQQVKEPEAAEESTE